MQLRFTTTCTGEQYVTEQQWVNATLSVCPVHSSGGCGFARHGTYERLQPPGTRIARWYCPTAQQTFSLLPDCLASHLSGTLAEVESLVLAIEQAPSFEAAAQSIRCEIELPGVLRFLRRRFSATHAVLTIVKGLFPLDFVHHNPTLSQCRPVIEQLCPEYFAASGSLLMTLRHVAQHYLPKLPTPVGFNPTRRHRRYPRSGIQHPVGADPPAGAQ
jgi:hypothetical protein